MCADAAAAAARHCVTKLHDTDMRHLAAAQAIVPKGRMTSCEEQR